MLEVQPISRSIATEFVKAHHYSEVMPRITRHCLGGFHDGRLVAVATLGFGTRPLHTIRKIFPTLGTDDYLELGKLCVLDEMPRNTESHFISRVLAWIRANDTKCLLLYSWADGIIGKPGYVYQASNAFYGGFIWTEMYIDKDGNRCHVRSIQGHPDLPKSSGKFKTRATAEIQKLGYRKIFGLQFRYLFPLCSRPKWNYLQSTSPIKWSRGGYPKDTDCKWKEQVEKGKTRPCEMPPGIKTKYRRA